VAACHPSAVVFFDNLIGVTESFSDLLQARPSLKLLLNERVPELIGIPEPLIPISINDRVSLFVSEGDRLKYWPEHPTHVSGGRLMRRILLLIPKPEPA